MPRPLQRALSVGAWRSLVARIVRDDEVGGSNPLAPTRLTFPVLRIARFGARRNLARARGFAPNTLGLEAQDARPEGRVPAPRLRRGGQREREVARPQDVDPLEHGLRDRLAPGV